MRCRVGLQNITVSMIGGIDWLIRGTAHTYIIIHLPLPASACPAYLPVGIISHLYHTHLIYNITVNTSSSELQAGSEQEARELVLLW